MRSKPGIENLRSLSGSWDLERDPSDDALAREEFFRTKDQIENRERRFRFYTINEHEIIQVLRTLLSDPHLQSIDVSRLVDQAALIVSEVAERAGKLDVLKLGDPEYGRSRPEKLSTDLTV